MKIDFSEEKMNVEGKAWKDLWSAGQGVASIKDSLSVEDLVNRLYKQFKEALERQKGLLDRY